MKNKWEVKFHRFTNRPRGASVDQHMLRVDIIIPKIFPPNLMRDFLDRDWDLQTHIPPYRLSTIVEEGNSIPQHF